MVRLLPTAAPTAAATATALALAGCSLAPGGSGAPPVERVETTIEAPESAEPDPGDEQAPGADQGADLLEGMDEPRPALELAGTSTVGAREPVVTADWLADAIESGLADEHGVELRSADCPEDLGARAGTVLRCELTTRADDDVLAADVLVDRVDGAEVSASVHLLTADAPLTVPPGEADEEDEPSDPLPAALVQDFVITEFRAETDRDAIAICPGGLPAEEGAGMTCTLYAGQQSATVEVTVDRVTEESVDFSIVID